MRCTNCGHQGAPSATFCLNCGTRLAAPGPGGTQHGAGGLPAAEAGKTLATAPPSTKMCERCQADNAPNMKFCRQCGAPLMAATPTPVPPVDSEQVKAQTNMAPAAVVPGRSRPVSPTPPPGTLSRPPAAIAPAAKGPQQCPDCGGQTPAGFSFCQRCGKPLAVALEKPESQRPTPKSMRIPTVAEPAWASLISVNRDGSDGASHALSGDYLEIGNTHCQHLRFDDPYLAMSHARIERLGPGSARIVPLDRLNGVFRRIRQDTPLEDGSMLLLGRELLRFEILSTLESKPTGLSQHGVALFGSPLREAWGRISQIVPSGGVRDIRHLFGEETVIGREEGDVVFSDDEFLSRRHAALRYQFGQCVLADLGSSNGTFVRIHEPVNLSVGDFLRMGDQMFRFKPEV